MIALIPDQAVPVVTGMTGSPVTAGFHAVLLVTLLVLVFEKVATTAVKGDASRRAPSLNVGLIPLGIGTAVVLAQAIG
jgi:hypothetical protein